MAYHFGARYRCCLIKPSLEGALGSSVFGAYAIFLLSVGKLFLGGPAHEWPHEQIVSPEARSAKNTPAAGALFAD
jgi:hypothetical protein